MTAPTFTIIVPALDAEAYIADAIESVLNQSRSDWELVVVEDGSRQPLAPCVEAYLDDTRVRLLTQDNAGPGAARNRAVGESHGRFLTMLDSDDTLLPDYLATVGSVLDTRPGVGLVGTDAQVLIERNGRMRRRTYLQGRHVNPPRRFNPQRHLERLLHHSFIPPMGTVRREVFDEVGGYDTNRELAEDWDLPIRVAATSVDIELLRRPLAVYRVRDNSRSRTGGVAHLDRAHELVALKALRDLTLKSAERRAARFVVRDARRRMALSRARSALLEGQVQTARLETRVVFRARPTIKGGLLIGALGIAPAGVRRIHSAKTAVRGRIRRVLAQHVPGGLR